MSRTAMEYAALARTMSAHARQASEEAVAAAGGGHHDTWLLWLQQCLTRAELTRAMAFDSVDAMMGGTIGPPPLIVEPDATSLAAEDMRAAASALRAAADALLHMATARGAGEGADDSNAEDTNSG